MTVGLPVWLDKPAETTSQNQSWSSALDPFLEPPGYGAAVKTHWANLVNVLDTHISTHI